jgi:hypothetical protein
MPEEDQPGVTGPEYPPPSPPAPTPLMFAIGALAFEIATFLALMADRDGAAFWLAALGMLAAGVLLFLLPRAEDVPGVVGPIPGPPPRMPAAIAFILALAAFLALLFDRADLALWLSAAAAVAAGVTVALLLRGRNRTPMTRA